ncbi:MAG: hypothetical protein ACFFB3_05290 [Candidatus Hodarchaeota archaeon]
MKRDSARVVILPILVALILFSLSSSIVVSQTGGTEGPVEPEYESGRIVTPLDPGDEGPGEPDGRNDNTLP